MKKSEIELRDWYAGLAMQAFISADDMRHCDSIAELAFQQAEVMMNQRREEMINE